MTKPERQAIIDGKHERIRKLLTDIGATRPAPMVRQQPWLAEVLDGTGLDRLSNGKETAFTGHSEADI